MFEKFFFSDSAAGRRAYETAMRVTVQALSEALPSASYAGGAPTVLARTLPAWREDGGSWAEALRDLRAVIAGSVAVHHPHTCAHLHCPVLLPALSAELALTALNQSMDSFDQAPAATLIEQQVCDWIVRLVGYERSGGASFTTGGTQSNYLALLLARDRRVRERWGGSVQTHGLPAAAAGKLRILCSEAAHFSVVKAAHQLGLGAAAVVTVPVDARARMEPTALARLIAEMRDARLEIVAVVATAGTTDAGAFDPLVAIADVCHAHRLWLHVDAAWGGAVLLSARHRVKVAGLERADSVTIDFHKGFYQPVSCSALALRRAEDFEFIRHHADYLNPEEHEAAGVPDLVTRSLLTTRRFDALKLWLTLRVVGAAKLGAMVDRTVTLAAEVAEMLRRSPQFELVCEPSFGSLLFRLRARPDEPPEQLEALHAELPGQLLHAGRGVIGFSKWRSRRVLKFTLLNPCIEAAEFAALLDEIAAQAETGRPTRGTLVRGV